MIQSALFLFAFSGAFLSQYFQLSYVRIATVTFGDLAPFLISCSVFLGLAFGLSFRRRCHDSEIFKELHYCLRLLVIVGLIAHFSVLQVIPNLSLYLPAVSSILLPFIIAIPFLYFGRAQKILLENYPAESLTIFGADALGLVSAIAISWFNYQNLHISPTNQLFIIALISIILSVLISGRPSRVYFFFALFLGITLLVNLDFGYLRIEKFRSTWSGQTPRHSETIVQYWDAYSFLQVGPTDSVMRVKSQLAPKLNNANQRYAMRVDGDTFSTRILRNDGTQPSFDWLRYDLLSYGFNFGNKRSALVLGAGGGYDLLAAINLGYQHVVGVEILPGIAKLLQGPFDKYSGGIYSGRDSRISLVVGEGRQYLNETDRTFDEISLVYGNADFGPLQTILPLKTFLLTEEAFRSYLRHLTDEGVLYVMEDLSANPKILAGLLQAAKLEGIQHPERHILCVGEKKLWGLFFKQEITPKIIEQALKIEDLYGHKLNWSWLSPSPFPLSASYSVRPLRDNQPITELGGQLDHQYWTGIIVVFIAMAMLVIFSLQKMECVMSRSESFYYCVLFALFGFFYALFQASQIFWLMYFLKNPFITYFIVLPILCITAGLSTLLARRYVTFLSTRWILVACLIALLATVLVLPAIFQIFITMSFTFRVVIIVLGLTPVGILIALPLPLLLCSLDQQKTKTLGNLLAIDAIFGAFGILSALPSIFYFGISMTLWFCIFGYGVISWMFYLSKK